MARSKCNLQLGDTQSALIDAELSLQEDKTFHKVDFELINVQLYILKQSVCIQGFIHVLGGLAFWAIWGFLLS